METKTCLGCGKEKEIGEFNYKVKVKGTRQRYCRICTRLQLRSHYERHTDYYCRKARNRNEEAKRHNQERIVAYLSEHPCVDCGEPDIVCLEFDHVQGKKKKAIAAMLGVYRWGIIEEEIAKCEVRCANCHRRKTAQQRGYYRYFGPEMRP